MWGCVDLPILIIEPEQSEKRDLAAEKLTRGGQKPPHPPPPVSITDLKQQIRKVRETARDNVRSLAQQLETSLKQRYPQAKVKSATDHVEATDYIAQNAGRSKVISTNNSVTVQELRPRLIENGFTVINSYHHEFTVNQKKIHDYWDLPRLLDRNLKSTFDIAVKMDGLPDAETRSEERRVGKECRS